MQPSGHLHLSNVVMTSECHVDSGDRALVLMLVKASTTFCPAPEVGNSSVTHG